MSTRVDAPAQATRTWRPGPTSTRLLGVLVGFAAALPSLIWALSDPDLLTDDYSHMDRLRGLGAWDAMWSWSFEHPARPLLGPYHLVTYGLIGDRPVAHALLMAVINGAVAVTIWRLGRRWIRPDVALAAALLYAVVPNRASTRLWFPTGNYLLAALIVLGGAHLLADRRQPRLAAIALAAGILLFEGVVGLAFAVVVLWAWPAAGARWRTALLTFAPSACAAGMVYVLSPKRETGVSPNVEGSLSTLGHGLFGSGLWGGGVASYVGAAAVAGLVVLALAALLPSFAALRRRTRLLRVALVLGAISTAPFVGAGLTFAVRGIFDRTNAVPLIGVTFLLAAAVPLLDGVVSRRALAIAGVLAAGYFTALSMHDVRDYTDAAEEGRLIRERILADVPGDAAKVLVWPTAGHDTGVAAFVYPSDLDTALRLRHAEHHGTIFMPWSAAQCRELAASDRSALGYDWRRRELVSDAAVLCER